MYIYIWKNYRVFELPWDSNFTWILGFIGMDFLYYWFHRAAHEINVLWASHQTHHSSEDYNLSTALRQSAFQWIGSMFFWLPQALLIPPSVHLVHLEINILFQFWIHTQFIDSIGPLEYILNTASHHRVHHGRNPYCIDKNYAGTLIIWDRMFGTFAAERKDEQIAYGLVHNLQTFDPLYVQVCMYWHLLLRFLRIDGLANKVSVLLKGPGWAPGKPRLGINSEIPEIKGTKIEIYGPKTPKWLTVYAVLQYLMVNPIYEKLMQLRLVLVGSVVVFDLLFILATLTCLGMLYDKKKNAWHVELVRCVLMCIFCMTSSIVTQHQLPDTFENLMIYFYLTSAAFCTFVIFAHKNVDGKKLQ